MTRILVAYGSKRGGTAGLAAMIRDALTGAGHQVAVSPARDIATLEGVEAVIVAGRWRKREHRLIGVDLDDLKSRLLDSGDRLARQLSQL